MPLRPATKANTVIRVMVNYTAAAASASGNISSLITLAVAETNQGYTNSGVAITVQLANSAQVTYTESGSFSTDLSRYRGTADGFMDSIHTTRNSTTADVGVLLINNASACGLASAIGATASTAFVAVYWDCATGYYSFAHEIGHLQSARHDPANDPTTTPYAWGHGYQYNGSPKWRTIMAYDCSGGCPRLNYWSNPSNLYQRPRDGHDRDQQQRPRAERHARDGGGVPVGFLLSLGRPVRRAPWKARRKVSPAGFRHSKRQGRENSKAAQSGQPEPQEVQLRRGAPLTQ